MTDGQWTPTEHKTLADTLRALYRTLKYQYTIDIQHVKSHQAHPWNEFADTLAKAACANKIDIFNPPFPTTITQLHPDLQWLWLHALQQQTQSQQSTAYPKIDNQQLQITRPRTIRQ